MTGRRATGGGVSCSRCRPIGEDGKLSVRYWGRHNLALLLVEEKGAVQLGPAVGRKGGAGPGNRSRQTPKTVRGQGTLSRWTWSCVCIRKGRHTGREPRPDDRRPN